MGITKDGLLLLLLLLLILLLLLLLSLLLLFLLFILFQTPRESFSKVAADSFRFFAGSTVLT